MISVGNKVYWARMKDLPEFYLDYPKNILTHLIKLRSIILDEAKSLKDVGPIEEALRWGQPSFMTTKTKSGSTIRIGTYKKSNDKVAIYFHCQTNLVRIFRLKFSEILDFEGNRAIILNMNKPILESEIRECVGLALRYHLIKNDFVGG